MTGLFWLDWAALAVSLHNTILLLWLGLTVLLNADRRRWGIWLSGGGLLLGYAFFVSHSAILGHNLNPLTEGLDFWWHVGWIPVITIPFGWYTITLWYSGFWDDAGSALRRRQRLWFILAGVWTLGLAVLLIFTNSIPAFAEVAALRLYSTLQIGGQPVLLLAYILDILLCILLSLDALRRPAPSLHLMGNLARARARPWLIAAALVLLLVGLLVAWMILQITMGAQQGMVFDQQLIIAVAVFDLLIASLIAAAILLVGQAVALYEVFTGKALPRRGLLRQWRDAVILAVGYSVVISWTLTIQLRPIYSVLLTAALMTAFYALFNWRTYAERERYMRQLRPFVASEKLYDRLLADTNVPEIDLAQTFRALCQEVLGTRRARLAAVGALAPWVPPLAYPERPPLALPPLAEIPPFDSPQTMCVALDPAQYDGALWAVPLWSAHGLSGVLLLGDKSDGGIYSQEEIEIARASGEHLIDTYASAELARRLMTLQRQRLAENQLLDQRARRVLHDDVLPQLHTAILALSGGQPDPDAIQQLTGVHRRISDLLREIPTAQGSDVARLGLDGALRRAVEEECAEAFDRVAWQIEPETERRLRTLPTATGETLFYAAREAIRNAARYSHGQDPNRPVHLCVQATWREGLAIVIEDDGVGLQAKLAGQGSGKGLALHSAMLAVFGGTLAVEPRAGGGTRVTLTLPSEAGSATWV